MAGDLVSAAFSVVGKALAPLTDDLLKDWAASVKLGDNVRALELELLSVKAILEPAIGKEIDNSALKELLLRLQDLGYDADDVLDELDYFRIQDKLDGTSAAAAEHARGCAHSLALHVRHTAKAAVGKLICLPACCSPAAAGKHSCFPCSSRNPLLKRWAVHAPCQLFPFMEVIVIMSCSELVELSFSHFACCEQEKVAYGNLFPRLSQLKIVDCRQLLSFPPVPWTADPCAIKIEGTGSPCLHSLVCEQTYNSEYRLTIVGRNTPHSTFWNVLAFHNLTRLKELDMKVCQPLPLHHLHILSSLRTLNISCASNALPFVEGDSHIQYQFPVEWLHISPWIGSGKELTQLLTYFPKLLDLKLQYCEKITRLGVRGQQATATSRPSFSANNKVDESQIEQHQQLDRGAEEEIAALAEGLLFLPPKLQKLQIDICPELILLSNPLERGWLQGLTSLQWLDIHIPHRLLSSSLFSCPPFPNSLKFLNLVGAVNMDTLDVSNLSSLTTLSVHRCGNLRGEGLFSLLTQGQGHLTKLLISKTPNFFVDSEPSRMHGQHLHSCSSKLQELRIDDVAGVTTTPIRSLLLSSLITLEFYCDNVVERFTEEQEALLFVKSLEKISFMDCFRLQHLPAWLHRLLNLKTLEIMGCEAIQMLPEDGLPSSLEELFIYNCPQIQSLSKNCLPSSLQKLVIRRCPAIQSLPKVDDLPSSLRVLYVESGGSMELRRQCRKLIGSIPIVKCD